MRQSKNGAGTEELPATGTTARAGGPEITTRPREGPAWRGKGNRAKKRGRRGHTLARAHPPRVPLALRAASVGPRGVSLRTTCRRRGVALAPRPPAKDRAWRRPREKPFPLIGR